MAANSFETRIDRRFAAVKAAGRSAFVTFVTAGDPDYDNYAHAAPGSVSRYSSGGYWRLSQALTAIWKKDLKQVLDERIPPAIGNADRVLVKDVS